METDIIERRLAVITPLGSNPGGSVSRWIRVRMSRPEAASSTTVRATSPTINACRKRKRSPPIAARLAMAERRSNFRVARAGSMPKSTLVRSERRSVNANTRLSRGTLATGRKCSGRSKSSPRKAMEPTATPAVPPTNASKRFSTQSCLESASARRRAPVALQLRSAPQHAHQRETGKIGAGDQQDESRRQHQR